MSGLFHPPTPTLTVIDGTQIVLTPAHVDGHTSKAVTIALGGALYVWEPGNAHPAYLPSAPDKHLDLIGAGTTPPRACPEIECAQGFFWEWVGVRKGSTAITMTPSCRRLRPMCEIASYAISVHIVSPSIKARV